MNLSAYELQLFLITNDYSLLNQLNEKKFLKTLNFHQPNFLLNYESSNNNIEKINWLILRLGKIYKKYSKPSKLNYYLEPCLDLSKIYRFKSYSITLNFNFIELRDFSQAQSFKPKFSGLLFGKISLKKYYKSRDRDSLFQSKGYSIKYIPVPRNKNSR